MRVLEIPKRISDKVRLEIAIWRGRRFLKRNNIRLGVTVSDGDTGERTYFEVDGRRGKQS